jgi:hypothetical protein
MKGKIGVQSEEGKGTVFKLYLPFTIAEEHHFNEHNMTIPLAYPNPKFSELSVAYVDMNASNRGGFEHLMKTLGVGHVLMTENIFELATMCHENTDVSFQVLVIDLTTVLFVGCLPLLRKLVGVSRGIHLHL